MWILPKPDCQDMMNSHKKNQMVQEEQKKSQDFAL